METINYLNNQRYVMTLESLFDFVPEKESVFLITGATGLIGSFLVDLLYLYSVEKKINHKIITIGRSKKKLKERFPYNSKNIDFFEHDLINPLSINEKIDYIIHAASNADPKQYALFPVETILTNINGMRNILEIGKKTGAKLLFTSTFEVYGKLENTDKYKENDYGIIDYNLRACYPESKKLSEILLHSYIEEYGVNAVVARLCSIYGPTMTSSDSKAHAQFFRNAINNENIILKSKGQQIRSYMYVADAVSALLQILSKAKTGDIYNVSNDLSVTSIKNFAEIVAQQSFKDIIFQIPEEIEKKGFSKPQNCILDNTKLKELGWRGNYNIEKGINETLLILKNI